MHINISSIRWKTNLKLRICANNEFEKQKLHAEENEEMLR